MSINCPEDCYYRVRRVLRDNSWTFPGIVWNIILSLPLSLYFSVTGDIYILHLLYSSLVAQTVKNLPAMLETWVWSLSQEDPLEKGIPVDRGAWQATVYCIYFYLCLILPRQVESLWIVLCIVDHPFRVLSRQ